MNLNTHWVKVHKKRQN